MTRSASARCERCGETASMREELSNIEIMKYQMPRDWYTVKVGNVIADLCPVCVTLTQSFITKVRETEPQGNQ